MLEFFWQPYDQLGLLHCCREFCSDLYLKISVKFCMVYGTRLSLGESSYSICGCRCRSFHFLPFLQLLFRLTATGSGNYGYGAFSLPPDYNFECEVGAK